MTDRPCRARAARDVRARSAAAALVLILAAPTPATAEAPQRSGSRPDVWMVGDSVTAYAETALRSRLAETVDGRVEIDAEIGRNVVVLDDLVRDELSRARRPRTMVLALGANPADSWHRRDFRRVVDSIPRTISVVLVTVFRNHNYASPAIRRQMADYSRWMRSIAATRSNVCVAPWRGTVRGHAAEYLLDGAHPNERGAAVLADLVADTVRRCASS